jgi:hypothetical protein
MRQKHGYMRPLTLRLWKVRLRLWVIEDGEEANDDYEPEDDADGTET